MSAGKRQSRRFQRPHSGLMTPRQETPSSIYRNDLYCQKLESLTYIFAGDSIGLSLLLFTQLSLEFEPSESTTASTKIEFYVK